MIEMARKELIDKLAEKLDIHIQDGAIEFKGKTGETFMEDNIRLWNSLDDITWGVNERVKETVTELMRIVGYRGIIHIDVWGKWLIGMTSELYKFVREVMDEIASKYRLLKLYSWGSDDGGSVVFVDGQSVIRTYYSRGCVDIDVFGPETEDQYWEYYTSEKYDEDTKEWAEVTK